MVVVRRISPPKVDESRRCACAGRQQSWDAKWRAVRTPPGSESRACIHRGNSETGESRLSPCTNTVGGADLSDRETPGGEVEVSAPCRANKERRYKVSGEDSEERTNLRWAVGSLSGT